MSVFDIFSQSKPAAPANNQQPAPPGNMNAPANPAAEGQGSVPASAAAEATKPKAPESPLDTFKDLWEPVTVDPNAQGPATPAPLTAEQIQQAVSKANFAQAITSEHMKAIAEGGEAAQKAFSEALNSVAQTVMVQSTMVNNKLTEKAVKEALEAESAKLPDRLREQQSTSHLNDTSALFSNPAIQPVVKATQAQLLQKFPNATPAEITKMTQDYIVAMGEQFAPKPPVGPGEQDWSTFLE